MKIVSIIFVICLIRNAHLKFAGKADPLLFSGNCFSNITSISTIAYNKQNPYGVEEVTEQDTCRYIGSNKKVVFTVHGFTSSPNISYIYDLVSQLVKNDYTVFSVDWTEGVCRYISQYFIAARNTLKVGKLMANYIEHITKECNVPLKNIKLIGHSLGAHICGFAAKTIKSSGIGTISRLFGADPAGPAFSYNDCEERLCDTDAERVIALHTTTKLGIKFPIEVEFFSICPHKNAVVYLTVLLERSECGFSGVSKLERFDQSIRPTDQSTDCIFVDRNIFERDTITSGAYTVFVNKLPYCSPNTFPNCQQ